MKQQANRKLMVTAALVAAGLALAGCAGGGSDTRADRADSVVDQLRQEIAELRAELQQAEADLVQLRADLTTAQTERDQARTDLATAESNFLREQNNVNTLSQQLTAAQMDDNADAAAIQRLMEELELAEQQRDAAQTERDNAEDMLETANMQVDDLQDELDVIEAERLRLLAEAEAALATAEAKKVDSAIKGNAGTAPMVALVAPSAGGLTATAAGYAVSATAPDAITGWQGAMLEKGGDTIVVYTNIESAEATLLDTLYASIQPPGGAKTYQVHDRNNPENSIPWSHVTRSSDTVSTTGTGGDRVVLFGGTVQGVPGTFSCTGLSCFAPARETDGSVADNTAARGWSFRPTDPNGMVDVPDAGYLSFGWWLGEDGEDYVFDAFASAHGDDLPAGYSESADNVEGTATYRGAAAGNYAMGSVTEDSASAGHFTASVVLAANFDYDDLATTGTDEDDFMLSGTISGFESGGASLGNWEVALSRDSAMQQVESFTTGGTATWSTGGTLDGTGSWSAELHGDPGDDNDEPPAAIVGEFEASIGEVARIRGAYGAMKE